MKKTKFVSLILLILGFSFMSIIIASKNIYSTKNQKVINNSIGSVNYSYDNMNETTKDVSFNYDIWSVYDGLNEKLKTIKHGTKLYVETELTIEDFSVSDIFVYIEYPNAEWVDRNGETHYGVSYRQGSAYYKELDRKLENDDELFSGGDFRLLVYKEVLSRSKTKLTCYFFAGITEGTYAGYNTSANICVSYNSYEKEEVSVDNNAKFSLTKNEFMQNTTITAGGTPIYDFISSKIVKNYKDGKETAIVRCSISEYYNENGKIAVTDRLAFSEDFKEITTSYKKNYIEYYDKSFNVPNGGNIDVEWYDSFSKYDFDAGCYNIIATPNSAMNYGYLRLGDNEDPNSCDFYVDIEFGKHYIFEIGEKKTLYFHFNKSKKYADDIPYPSFLFKISFSEKIQMTFLIGDQVIPMVFGADGRDRPMSRYNDGSPKVFNVVGRKMIYDGAVWQELTLQEKTQSV